MYFAIRFISVPIAVDRLTSLPVTPENVVRRN